MSPRQKFIAKLLRNGAVLVGDPKLSPERLLAEIRRRRERAEFEAWLRRTRRDDQPW